MSKRGAKYWKVKLSLIPHREGGHFREIYRCSQTSEIQRPGTDVSAIRNHSTAIYFLLENGEKNALHRIKSDEVWHFYDGSPLAIHEIDSGGRLKTNHLGLDAGSGESPVVVIKAGNWFCAEVTAPGGYTLSGCTVAPGFDFDDFELADKDSLCGLYPLHKEFIKKFSP